MGVQDYLNKVIESALHYPVTFSGDKKAILNRWLVKAEIVDVLNENGVDPYISENGIVISENEADNLSDEEIESNWRYYISDHERSFYHYNSPEKLFKNACEKGKEKMVYCLCNIFSNDDKEVLVHISTNLPSPIRVWINGELCVSGNPNYFAKNSAFIFKLNKGNNAVLVERSMFVRNRMLSIATRFFTFVVTPFDEFISNKTNKRFLDRNVLNYLKFGYAIIPSKAFYQPGEKVSFIILPKSMPYSKNVPVKVTVKTALGRTVSTIFAEVLKVVSVETDDSVRGVISIIAEGNAGYKKKEIVNVFYGNFKEEKNKLIEKAMERQDSNEEMIKTFSEITDMYDMRTGLIKAGSETMHEYMYHQMFEACLNFERYVFKPNSGKKLSLFDVFKESVMVFDKSDIDGGYFIYNIYLPSNYSHNKEYALLVYMIFDDSMTRYPVHPYRIVREKSGDAIVLSFVTRWEYQWDYINEINIINVVNETLEKFNINRDRVYLIGICAGANRAFNLLCKIPDVFSAFINIAGTPIFDDKEPESLNLDNIRNTPIELLFTVNDMWYNVSAVINSLKTFYKAKQWIFHDIEHEEFIDLFNSKKLLNYIMKIPSCNFPKVVQFTTSEPVFNKSYWLKIENFISLKEKATVYAQIEKRNMIRIECNNIDFLSILINRFAMDIDQNITIAVNGIEKNMPISDYCKIEIKTDGNRLAVNEIPLCEESFYRNYRTLKINENLLGIRQLYLKECLIVINNNLDGQNEEFYNKLYRILQQPLEFRARNYRYKTACEKDIGIARLGQSNFVAVVDSRNMSSLHRRIIDETGILKVGKEFIKLKFNPKEYQGEYFALIKAINPFNAEHRILAIVFNSDNLQNKIIDFLGSFSRNPIFNSDAVVYSNGVFEEFRYLTDGSNVAY